MVAILGANALFEIINKFLSIQTIGIRNEVHMLSLITILSPGEPHKSTIETKPSSVFEGDKLR